MKTVTIKSQGAYVTAMHRVKWYRQPRLWVREKIIHRCWKLARKQVNKEALKHGLSQDICCCGMPMNQDQFNHCEGRCRSEYSYAIELYAEHNLNFYRALGFKV